MIKYSTALMQQNQRRVSSLMHMATMMRQAPRIQDSMTSHLQLALKWPILEKALHKQCRIMHMETKMEIIKRKKGNYNVEVIFFIMPVHFVMVEFVLWLIRLFNVRQICEID